MIFAAIVKDEVVGVVSDVESSSEALEVAREDYGPDIERVEPVSLTEADDDMKDAFGDA